MQDCLLDFNSVIIEDELWTSRQRQSSSIHEVSYRACFKAELPRFFINKFSKPNEIIFDPFSGRGTTGIEAGLLARKVILNDINPLTKILSEPRFNIIEPERIEKRLNEITYKNNLSSDIDLSMFYHKDTLNEILSVREYLNSKAISSELDIEDKWIKLLITNRLTGHSSGFLSVYTMPPNQAVSPKRQIEINKKLNNTPEYRNLKNIVFKKYKSLIRNLTSEQILNLKNSNPVFLTEDAANVSNYIKENSVSLTVTSPPFLDIVNYKQDNWLRLWFNSIEIENNSISSFSNIELWNKKMEDVLNELYEITKPGGYVAFEVGEVRNKKVFLEKNIEEKAIGCGFIVENIFINSQDFTKTSNIWGVNNNTKGTNSNRIVLMRK